MEPVLTAIITVGAIGLLAGIILGVTAKIFYVHVDPRIGQVADILPGANCGGCGYAGCTDLAAAIVQGNAPANGCKAASDELAQEIASMLGISVDKQERQVAQIFCQGNATAAGRKFVYMGIQDCRAAQEVSGGDKSCRYGCLGLGTCVRACFFGALQMGPNGLPVVDTELCTGCGSCAQICPRHIPRLIPVSQKAATFCSSHDVGRAVKEVCTVGCLGDGLCKKVCPENAVTIDKFLSVVDPVKCTGCGLCFEKCIPGIIQAVVLTRDSEKKAA
jgi:Na+-translocating ferredoxin:NAD+ oxidoreductase RNF subunit RnfB